MTGMAGQSFGAPAVFLKSTVLPWESVHRPSSRIWRRRLKTWTGSKSQQKVLLDLTWLVRYSCLESRESGLLGLVRLEGICKMQQHRATFYCTMKYPTTHEPSHIRVGFPWRADCIGHFPKNGPFIHHNCNDPCIYLLFWSSRLQPPQPQKAITALYLSKTVRARILLSMVIGRALKCFKLRKEVTWYQTRSVIYYN